VSPAIRYPATRKEKKMRTTRRDFLRWTTGAMAGMAFGGSAGALADRNSGPPNILLILVDDFGDRSLSCFGATVPTPNLDRLAKGGMVFRNAHAAPMCAPTRDEMFTGLSRARFKGRPGAETPFFTNHLRKSGYATGMAGKWFVGSVFDPPARGFDESCILVNGYRHWAPDVMLFGSGGMMKKLNQPKITGRLNEWEISLEGDGPHRATRLADRYGEDVAVDFLCDFLQRRAGAAKNADKPKPFFAYYSSKLTHVPAAPTPDGNADEIAVHKAAFAAEHDRHFKNLPEAIRREADRRGVRINSRGYRNAGIAYLDKMVGRLMDKLGELGIERDTMVVFASDNGNSALDPLPDGATRLPGRKGDSREGGTRIPMIVSWPRRIAPGSTCDDLVHVQDYGPTLLELAGAAAPQGTTCDGISFAPQILGRKPDRTREWFVGYGAHASIWLARVREELGKPNLEAYRQVWVHGWRFKLYNDGRFYDLKTDLAEARRIPPGKGTAEAEAARTKFQAILDGLKRSKA